ncbi:MAG: DUF1846 domain-containing protein [Candidatus Borkfalkiaceae bacterium]|nr:DUF1846 domain-containing protein [Christensenellaceae bacterium]
MKGFDSEKYLTLQSEKILERIDEFGGKLYIEFGGKLFDDYHAARVLPGFEPDNKIKMLCKLKDRAEIVIVINSNDIAKNKVRADLGITYDQDVLRLIDVFESYGLYVGSIVLAQFTEENEAAKTFEARLAKRNVRSYRHYPIKGYPNDVPLIVSEQGYGKNDYIETSRDLIIITAPGPGSGKMATCLSQLYQEHCRGNKVGYAKYETFPIWNLPLNHMVNLAYEAATADLNDVNMIDPWHLAAYGKQAVNYNRDVEIFPVLNAIFEQIMGKSPYKSPTDMGVNMAGYAISDDAVCVEAAKQEIIRRYFKALQNERRNGLDPTESDKIALIMKGNNIEISDRKVVVAANRLAEEKGCPVAAIELPDGKIVTGKTNDLFGCSSSMLLNALKYLAGIDEEVDLIGKESISPIQDLKIRYLGSKNPRLHIDEMLIALSSSAAGDENAAKAIRMLPMLRGCEVHTTVLLAHNDEKFYRKLGVHLTSNPVFKDRSHAH